MPEGFHIASMYADLNIDVDTAMDGAIAKLRARAAEFDKVGKDLGKSTAGGYDTGSGDMNKAVNRTVKRIAKDNAKDAEKAGEDLGKSTSKGFEKGSQETDKATEKVAQRTQAKFDALKFTVLSMGLPAAATAGAVGAEAALAAVPIAVIAAGVALTAQNQQIRNSFTSLANDFQHSTSQMANVMVAPLTEATNEIHSSFDRLKPTIQDLFNSGAQDVKPLTSAITDLAENALPGIAKGTRDSSAAMDGFASLTSAAGEGVGALFVNASHGAGALDNDMIILGHTFDTLLGGLGTIAANLSRQTPAIAILDGTVTQLVGTLTAVTAAGSGVMGFFTGFGSSALGMVTVLHGAASVLSLLPPGLTQVGGAIAATSMVAQKFGVDTGAAFQGVGQNFKTAIKTGSGFGTAFSSLLKGAFNPVSLGVAALGIGLDILGQKQKDAAANAAYQADRERDLASALRESGGAIDANVRSTATQQLQQFKLADGTRDLLADTQKLAGNEGLGQLQQGYLGNSAALDQLKKHLQDNVAAHTTAKQEVDDYGRATGVVTQQVDAQGQANQQLLDILNGAGGTFTDAISKNKELANAQATATATTQGTSKAQELAVASGDKLSTAIAKIGDTSSTAADKGNALITVLDTLAGRTPSHEQAIKSINDTIRGLADNFVKGANHADGWGKSLLNADGTVNTLTKNGSDLQGQMVSLQSGFANAGASIDDLVSHGMTFSAASQQVNGELTNQRQRFIDVATQMGLTAQQASTLADKYGLIPNAVVTEVSDPGAAAATQAMEILKGKVLDVPDEHTVHTSALTQDAITKLEGLGYKVTQLPDGSFDVSADTSSALSSINSVINFAENRKIRLGVGIGSIYASAAGGQMTKSGPQRFAIGGQANSDGAFAPIGGGWVRGPGGPRDDLIPTWLSNKEFVVNAADTEKWLPQLLRINRGQDPWPEHQRSPGSVSTSPRTSAPAHSTSTTTTMDRSVVVQQTINGYTMSPDDLAAAAAARIMFDLRRA